MSDMIDNSEFERCINASDLIDWIIETCPDWCEGAIRTIVDHIDEMPSAQPEQRWIPCSERLPKMGQPVIDNYASLNWLSFCSDGKEWVFQRPGEIISWYPLPELHQGEGEQDG